MDFRANKKKRLFDFCLSTREWREKTPECLLKTPWPESASELYRPSDHRLSVKLVPTFEDKECHVISVTDPTAGAATYPFKYLLNCTHEAEWTPFQTHYFSEKQVAPRIDLDLWICSQVLWPLDHRGSPSIFIPCVYFLTYYLHYFSSSILLCLLMFVVFYLLNFVVCLLRVAIVCVWFNSHV
jgi:hypothetical protein